MAIGNTKLHKLLDNASRLSDLQAWFSAFDPKTKELILDWIREDQLREKGVNAEGDVIGYYSYATELLSGGEKQEGTPYTLYDTGEFYRSMYMVVLRDAVVFEADPIKGDDNLFEKYGRNIIGLTEPNKDKLRQLVKTKYIEYFKKTLYGTL